ncbi:MAG: hypothetical protein H7319_03960 [Spirosoma sp.]|nr:hypothetical protein [Spirosoma sp.]
MRLKLRLIVIAGLLALSYVVPGQTPPSGIILRCYVAVIRFVPDRKPKTGVLFDLTDSTILLAPVRHLKPRLKTLMSQHDGTLPPTDSLLSFLPLRAYRYADISRVVINRRGQGGKGFLIGAGLGVAIGFIEGSTEIEKLFFITPTAKAIEYGLLLSIPGLLIGANMTNRITAKKQSIADGAKSRFRKFTIVEQLQRADLYTP